MSASSPARGPVPAVATIALLIMRTTASCFNVDDRRVGLGDRCSNGEAEEDSHSSDGNLHLVVYKGVE